MIRKKIGRQSPQGTGYPEDDPADPEPFDTWQTASRGEEASHYGQN